MKRTSHLPGLRFFSILLGIVACLFFTPPGIAGENGCLSCHTSPDRIKAALETAAPVPAVSGCQSLTPRAEG